MHDQSCFITLTYDDDHLPANRSLCQEDVTKFLKRLRKFLYDRYQRKVRYFYCGEYGTKTLRPHYHLCLFNFDFSERDRYGNYVDRTLYKVTANGDKLWKSSDLERIWGKGFCPFGDLTFDSASYTARYVLKKVNGPMQDEYYQGRKPEFICMSRMPGIGSEWLKKFSGDIYPKDYLTLRNGIKARPPKYFDRIYKEMHCDNYNEVTPEYQRFIELKKRRADYAVKHEIPLSELRQREEVTKILTKQIFERRKQNDVG